MNSLSKKCGITQAQISRLASGNRKPRIEYVRTMAEVLGLPKKQTEEMLLLAAIAHVPAEYLDKVESLAE